LFSSRPPPPPTPPLFPYTTLFRSTNVFTGRPARGIVNRYIREVGPMSPDAPQFPLAAGASQPMRTAGEAKGMADFTPAVRIGWRSEEHTSELQSRSDLVCRLLLEK